MIKDVLSFLGSLLAAAVSYYFGVPIWLLFILMSVFFLYRAVVKRTNVSIAQDYSVDAAVQLGEFGYWKPEEKDDDICFGLYVELQDHAVFVDISEDTYLESRKERALEILANSRRLDESLALFVEENPDYASKTVAAIGLHSPEDPTLGEVFWDPSGHSALVGLAFVR